MVRLDKIATDQLRKHRMKQDKVSEQNEKKPDSKKENGEIDEQKIVEQFTKYAVKELPNLVKEILKHKEFIATMILAFSLAKKMNISNFKLSKEQKDALFGKIEEFSKARGSDREKGLEKKEGNVDRKNKKSPEAQKVEESDFLRRSSETESNKKKEANGPVSMEEQEKIKKEAEKVLNKPDESFKKEKAD